MRDDERNWHLLTYLAGLVALSGRVEPERQPQSMLIVGEPATGKTANLERLKPVDGELMNPQLHFISNATAMGLAVFMKESVAKGTTHMVIPEFQTLVLKRGGVWETMLGILLPAMQEGVGKAYVGPKPTDFGGVKFGVIGAMTLDSYYGHADMLRESGFLSRMMVVKYQRSHTDIVLARHKFNAGDRSELSKVDTECPDAIRVECPLELQNVITDYAATVDRGNVNREASRFLILVKAAAWAARRKVVTMADVANVVTLEHFWRF